MGRFLGIGQGSGIGGFAEGLQHGIDFSKQQEMDALKRKAYTAGVVNPALRADTADQAWYNKYAAGRLGQTPQVSNDQPGLGQRLHQVFDPVISRFYNKFRPQQANGPGPAAQTTVGPESNQAASPPQPGSSETATALPAEATQGAWNASNYGPQMANGGEVGKPRGVLPVSGTTPKSGIKPKPLRRPPARESVPTGGDQGVPMLADGGALPMPRRPGQQTSGLMGAVPTAAPGSSVGDPRFQDNPNENPAALAAANALPDHAPGFAGAQAAPPKEAAPAVKQALSPSSEQPSEVTLNSKPASGTAAPLDFSKIDIDHRDIPQVGATDWENIKNDSVAQMVAHGMDPLHAQVSADESLTGYQQKQFTEYLQQGIALDRAGNKKGAMAALRTAYQYMPTGQDMHFGTAPNGDIVGFGIDEKTGQPSGSPLLLDQKNLNSLLATYQNPENFRSDLAGYQGMDLARRQFTEVTKPLAGAQTGLMGARSAYLYGANQAKIDAAQIHATGGKSNQLLQNSRFFEQQLSNDPDMMSAPPGTAGQLASVAAQLQANAPGVPQAQILAAVKNLLRMTPEQQGQWFQKYGIDPTGGQQAQQGDQSQQSGIPPSPYASPSYDALYGQ